VESNKKIKDCILFCLKQYNPEMIALFGSYARNEQTEKSDIDILVKFNKTYSLLQLIRIENELSYMLGIKVDLLTPGALKNEKIKISIEKDLQIIYNL
jgi:predicted nucleotidyltransferase